MTVTARIDKHVCPGCGFAVHNGCGYFHPGPIKKERLTCHLCFDQFGRAISGPKDVLYMSEKIRKDESKKDDSKKKDPSKQPDFPPTQGSPAENTRAMRPSLRIPTPQRIESVAKEPRPHQLRKWQLFDKEVVANNPSDMYPEDASDSTENVDKWWLDDDDKAIKDITPAEDHLAETPVESHILSRMEVAAFASHHADPRDKPKSFLEIVGSAIAMRKILNRAEDLAPTVAQMPAGLHLPDFPFSDQDLVNICCLVDRNREFEVDTLYTGSSRKCSLMVDSYNLKPNVGLAGFLKTRRKAPEKKMSMTVYKSWLKKYLDWFNPDLFDYLQAHSDGVKVVSFADRFAADDTLEYNFQGRLVIDKLMVPLPKMHKEVSTIDQFGVMEEGVFVPYCKDSLKVVPTHSRTGVLHPSYDPRLTKSCNPSENFEYVPVARLPSGSVPYHLIQIKAIRAEILKKNKTKVTRWLGLQGGKYVSLPAEWVALNFEEGLLKEATGRAENAHTKEGLANQRFLPLPVGDSRDDDPPSYLRDNQGLNYYYQGQVDNCVMGGFANAVFWFSGPESSDTLLKDFSVSITKFWFHFVTHVNLVLKNYVLKKYVCDDILNMDDGSPVVVQLRSGDKSETHSISIFQGRIYDSASGSVLSKTKEALDWCCGSFGFETHLRLYRLEYQERKDKPPKKKKARHTPPI